MFTFPCGSRGALFDLTLVQGFMVNTRIIRIHIGPLKEPMLAQDAAYVSALLKSHHKNSSQKIFAPPLHQESPIQSTHSFIVEANTSARIFFGWILPTPISTISLRSIRSPAAAIESPASCLRVTAEYTYQYGIVVIISPHNECQHCAYGTAKEWRRSMRLSSCCLHVLHILLCIYPLDTLLIS